MQRYLPNPRAAAVARKLYGLFISPKRLDVTEVAARIGISGSSLYGYAEGRVPAPAWLPAAIFEATRDLEVWRELTGAVDLGIACTVEDRAPATARSVECAALHLGGEVGDVLDVVRQAAIDGRISESEAETILVALDRQRQAGEELRAQVLPLARGA